MEHITIETARSMQRQMISEMGYGSKDWEILDSLCNILYQLDEIGFNPKRNYTEDEIDQIKDAISNILRPYPVVR